jgi:GTP cyclohydrolase I
MSAGNVDAVIIDDAQPRLRVVEGRSIDLDAATGAIVDLLLAMGQDPDSEQLADTPRSVATALATFFAPEPFVMTAFANDADYDEMVIVRDIAFQSLCPCHMLPFRGFAHVAYVPATRIVGLSKIVRVVDHLSRGLWTQVRLTTEVADALQTALDPHGVGVVMTATHLCMTPGGPERSRTGSAEPATVTTTMRGSLRDDPATRDEFIRLTSEKGR